MFRTGFILCSLLLLLLGSLLAYAQVALPVASFQLALPIQCQLNQNCWVYNYVDLDPSTGVLDPGCGHRTYDGHTGTDFGLRDLAQMRAGVSVLASAGGVVKGARDGMADVSVDVVGKASIQGRECGNGVLIDHQNGWTTQYCHMRSGSVKVQPGDVVATGQPLGLVGLSGNTEFPHVHLTVRYQDQVMDPFLGQPLKGQCRGMPKPLWKNKLAYQSMSLVNLGVASTQPDVNGARNGDFQSVSLSKTAPMLIFWVDALGIEPGDALKMTVLNPHGEAVVDQTTPLQSRKARWFQYVGKKRQTASWPVGSYKAMVTLSRQPGGVSQTRSLLFTVQ